MPMANIIAVVAVLDIHPDSEAVMAPKANRMRLGRWPIQGRANTANANLRSSRCRKMARARMNEPMNKNISGSAKGAKTSLAGATCNTTQAAAPSSAVTGSASASVIHKTTTAAMIAASRWASGLSSGNGQSQTAAKANGANQKPARRRQFSKICSPRLSVWISDSSSDMVTLSWRGPQATGTRLQRASRHMSIDR